MILSYDQKLQSYEKDLMVRLLSPMLFPRSKIISDPQNSGGIRLLSDQQADLTQVPGVVFFFFFCQVLTWLSKDQD